jgi:hypothetical protein
MQASWSRAVGLLVWALSVLPAVAAEEGVVRLRALSGDAIAGIPVVVELQIANPTASAITTFDLDDPAIARIFWTWRTASGKTLDVRMRQYHFSVIPEPAFPRKLQVPPQGMVSRFHTVPTPLDFPSDEAWVLGVKIRDPIDQTLATAEVSYTGHAGTPSGAIDPEIAQAALLEYSRADVLDHQVPKPVLAELSAAPQGRDPAAGLLLVSQRLHARQDATADWAALDGAPAEARILRAYLLLVEVQEATTRAQHVPAEWLRLSKRLQASEPLTGEVKDALRSRFRAVQ